MVKKPELRRIQAGLYAGAHETVCVNMSEFLAEHGLPDQPEVRQAIMAQIERVYR